MHSNLSIKEQRILDLASEKGASSWLTSLPLESCGFTLNKQEFHDAMLLRYDFRIKDIASVCACGENNNVNHTLICKKGGFVSLRHNNLRDVTAGILRSHSICKDVQVEPVLLPVTGEHLTAGTVTGEARLDESAEALAEAFSSVFVHEPESLPSVERPEVESESDILSDIDITFDKVKHQLESLNCFKSFGPDGVHPKLLKSLANDSSFVEAVVKLFRECTDSGVLPKVWKSASVSALFKSGSKTDPLNYRPVSLTCILCKVYEKILRDDILAFVENKISPHQHGFVKGKSCLSNMLETMDYVMDLLEQGIPVDLLYFDFKKAFDTVPHNRLLLKLECLGISGKVLDVIKDFLEDRTFRVSVQGKFSSWKNILSGIPQVQFWDHYYLYYS